MHNTSQIRKQVLKKDQSLEHNTKERYGSSISGNFQMEIRNLSASLGFSRDMLRGGETQMIRKCIDIAQRTEM